MNNAALDLFGRKRLAAGMGPAEFYIIKITGHNIPRFYILN